MKTTALLVLALAGSALSSALLKRTDHVDGCNANNCARAVTGTRFSEPTQAAHRADCSSFLSTTIQGYATITPTAVPTYATACADGSAYSSACSCWGVLPATVYVPW